MVGDPGDRREWLKSQVEVSGNIILSCLGDMVPIPRKLFEKIDVVIAGSGCANCAACEKVPTIVVDAGNKRANGILGYTTFSIIFHEENVKQMGFDQALEQVLLDRLPEKIEFRWPDRLPASHYYEQHMQFVDQSEKKQVYYQDINSAVRTNYVKVLKYGIRKHLPFIIAIYDKLKFFRAGRMDGGNENGQ